VGADQRPKVVVVTGASAGAGRSTAQAFGARGDRVGLIARGETGLAGAAKDVEQAGGEALTIAADVADPDATEAAAQRIESTLGPIDVWVNNATASVFAPVHLIEPAEFRRVTEVTYLGTVYGTMVALRRMIPRDAGVIVQVGSALAHRAIPLQSAYCGAKHAIQGFTESLRTELLHDRRKIGLTMVQLPALNTPQFDWVLSRLPNRPRPVPPIYAPEVAARAVVYASEHPERREYWIGGTTVATVAANKVAGGVLDRYLGRAGYSSQQTKEPEDPQRSHNLWEPLDGPNGHDFGAHGRFGVKAKQNGFLRAEPSEILQRLRERLRRSSADGTGGDGSR
jgi:NAD(P)-dependent dehydrogenase (short-subunit alcohol dehydrogenase family)